MKPQQARKPPFEAYKGVEPYVFISYAHSDGDAVFEHLEQLRSRGVRVWYDEGIDPGNEWPEEIARALDRCALFIFFVSPRSVVSKNCRDEVNFALNASKPFLAIHMEETTLPVGLSLRMGSIQAIMQYRMPEDAYWRKVLKVLDPFRVREGAAATDAFDQGLHMPPVPVDDAVSNPGSGTLPAPPPPVEGRGASPALPLYGAAGMAGVASGYTAGNQGPGHQPHLGVQGHPGPQGYSPALGASPALPATHGASPAVPYAQPYASPPLYPQHQQAHGTGYGVQPAAASASSSSAGTVFKILLGIGAAFFLFICTIAVGLVLYMQPWKTEPAVVNNNGDDKKETEVATVDIGPGKDVSIAPLGFLFTVPDSWEVKTNPEISKYQIALGPKKDDFTNNINVVDEEYKGTIDQYVEANMVTLRKSFKNLKVVSSGPFDVDSGMDCRRVITEHNTFNDNYLRQTFYFFKPKSGGDTWVVLTTSSARSNGRESQPLFDSIVKTVRTSGSGSSSTSTASPAPTPAPVTPPEPPEPEPAPSVPNTPSLTKDLSSDMFSLKLPGSWEVRPPDDKSKFPKALGPRIDDFTCNLNATDEEYSGTLKEYVDANMRTLRKEFKNMKVVSDASFITTSNVPGWRVITEHNTFNDIYLRQTFYFFKSNVAKTYLVITTSATQKAGPDIQPTFDAILKSFTLESGGSNSSGSSSPSTPPPAAPEPPAPPKSTVPALTQEVRSQEGNFVYKIPAAWTQKLDTSKSKYPLAFGPTTGDFTSNLNAVDESYTGTIQDYVDGNLKSLKDFKNFKIVERSAFTTDSGLQGVKLVTEHNNFNERWLRQVFYFLRGSKAGQYLILTSTAPLSVAVEQQPIFDAILRTFRYTNTGGLATPAPATSGYDTEEEEAAEELAGGKSVRMDTLGFSYTVPKSWNVSTDTSISKYPLARGPVSDNFTANFNAVDEDYTGTIDQYVEANMVTLRKSFKNLTVVAQGKFTTASGLDGRRVVTEHNTFQSRYLRQTFYFFKSPFGRKWVVLTSSTTKPQGAKLQPLFDAIMRTVKRL